MSAAWSIKIKRQQQQQHCKWITLFPWTRCSLWFVQQQRQGWSYDLMFKSRWMAGCGLNCLFASCWWNDDVIKKEQLTSEISSTTIGIVHAWDFTLDPVHISLSSVLPFSLINQSVNQSSQMKGLWWGQTHISGWFVKRDIYVKV